MNILKNIIIIPTSIRLLVLNVLKYNVHGFTFICNSLNFKVSNCKENFIKIKTYLSI